MILINNQFLLIINEAFKNFANEFNNFNPWLI
jgi:hypothetical protein